MYAGDTFFIAVLRDGSVMIIITPAGSTIQNQLLWLFGLEEQPELEFSVKTISGTGTKLDFTVRYILDEIGIEPEDSATGELDALIAGFGMHFPTTRAFSMLARTSLPDVNARDDADAALMTWLDREELLFRRLERHIVAARLQTGFTLPDDTADVDGFLSFSLSVQNRRKSRAGQSLENHLEALFSLHGIHYSRGAETENRHKPDFLFPGHSHYHDMDFPKSGLTMLASKSTLKDRWRQVLTEANRIPDKHLLTLEPGISENQTDQMKDARLQLILPQGLHSSYRPAQRSWIMSLTDFIDIVKLKQGQTL